MTTLLTEHLAQAGHNAELLKETQSAVMLTSCQGFEWKTKDAQINIVLSAF